MLILQTVFIISVCNNQLLDWIENELIWMLSFIPGVASALPSIVAKLHAMKEKYMAAPLPVTSNIKVHLYLLNHQLYKPFANYILIKYNNHPFPAHLQIYFVDFN